MAITPTEDITGLFVWAYEFQKSCLVDNVSATQAFVGVANDVTNQSSPIFTIFQFIFNANGNITSVTRAVAVAWTNRASATYV